MEFHGSKIVFYLILGLVYLIYNYYKFNGKNKKNRNVQSEKKTAHFPSAEKYAQDTSSVPESKTVLAKNRGHNSEYNITLPNYDSKNNLFHQVEVDDIHRNKFMHEHNESDNLSILSADLENEIRDYDLKNMVVYHEILKRPKY